MHKRTRRKLSALRRASGNILETSLDMFGRHVVSYDGIPIFVDDFMSIAETQGTENAASSIYAVKWGADGVMGIQNGGVQVETVGELETKDATRHRIKWYCGAVNFSDYSLARVKGINAS